jgi:SsrA-binding protein
MAKKNKGKAGLLSINAQVADNRRARFDYFLEEKFEAGIALTGTEVKSLRHGQASIVEAYVGPYQGGIAIFNLQIPVYAPAGAHLQHEPKRIRNLLLKKKEIDRLIGAVTREGYTIIPTRLYFNARGLAKLEVALAKGKKNHDKRDAMKARDWGRDKHRVMRDKG